MSMKVTPRQSASRRTKSRLGKLGVNSRILGHMCDCPALHNREACLIENTDTGWYGWVPCDEILIEETI